jgi:rhodanese-related sulfurtransferase
MKKTVRIALLSAVAAFAATGCASLRQGTSAKGLELPIEKAAIRFAADVREGGYKVVPADELKKWLDAKRKLVVVDTLPADERAALGHIEGSVNAPMPKSEKELTPADKERLLAAAGPDKDAAIVLYCGFVACRRSHHGARILLENGYSDVNRYPAGIVGWMEAGYPLAK